MDELSEKEIEALELMASGYRHALAAHKLGLTESGFKQRLVSARLKLGARTTTEAAVMVAIKKND